MHRNAPRLHRRTGLGVAAVTTSLTVLTAPSLAATDGPQAVPAPQVHHAASGGTANSASVPNNVQLVRTRASILGTHKWYRQVKNGHFVAGAWYARHFDNSGHLTVWDGRQNVSNVATTTPEISRQSARSTAAQAADASSTEINGSDLVVLPSADGIGQARLVWAVSAATGAGATTTYVDAVTGAVLKTMTWSKKSPAGRNATIAGTGQVFDPNPVVKLQDESLRDLNDSADAVPAAGYSTVRLRRLDSSHTLSGRWVRITNQHRASSPTDQYIYNRANDKFEQVNAYYAVDKEQAYLRSLGLRDVNAEPQKVKVDAFRADNSYYNPTTDGISLGSGGVDDAEDPEVIWHEYGHAIQDDQVIDFGWTSQAQAIGEGFGDYMAVTMSQATADGTAVTPLACVMDWDATSYTFKRPHCLRRTDTDKRYPRDLTGEEHADGKIWSRALWHMNRKVGRDTATRVIVEAQFWMNPKISMPDAAEVTVETARRLYPNDGTVAVATRRAFARRGIL